MKLSVIIYNYTFSQLNVNHKSIRTRRADPGYPYPLQPGPDAIRGNVEIDTNSETNLTVAGSLNSASAEI
jgi:hypothetical protein